MGHACGYGTPWVHTPNFDRLAEQGVLFMNAYTPDAKCSPSRACILTGRNPWLNEAAADYWPTYPSELKSWMEALGDGGYTIGYTGKGWAPGTLPPERTNITGKTWKSHHLKPPTSGMGNTDYAAIFADFLEAAPKDQPFCFWIESFASASAAIVGGIRPGFGGDGWHGGMADVRCLPPERIPSSRQLSTKKMKLQLLLEKYGESHRNGTNKLIHWICVPCIMFSLFGLLYSIPFLWVSKTLYMNWAALAMVLAWVYYLRLSISMFLGFVMVGFAILYGNQLVHDAVGGSDGYHALVSAGIFVVAWIGQFIGHGIEGEKPSFLDDLQFFMIGPAWLLHFIYKKMGIPY